MKRMKYLIKKRAEQKFQKYLEEAIKLNEEGLTNGKIERFHNVCYILTDLIEEGITHSWSLSKKIENIIMNKRAHDISSLLKKLNEDVMIEPSLNKYYFVTTMNVDLRTLERREYDLNKIKIKLVDYNSIESQFKISELFKKWHLNRPHQVSEFFRYSYFIAEIEASDNESAFENGHKIFETFRGLLNFAHFFDTMGYIYYGGIPEPRTLSILQPSKVFILYNENKEFLSDRFTLGYFDYSINRFHTDRNQFLQSLISKVNDLKECSLRERCLTLFRKYNDGLDGNVSGTLFLEFWKIFELIALSDKTEGGLAEIKVANRISSIFSSSKDYEFAKDILYALCNKRNYIAHIGSLPEFDQNEINCIRKYCEASILFLLNVANIYEDEPTLEYFYENITKSNKDLIRVEKVLSEIRKIRNIN